MSIRNVTRSFGRGTLGCCGAAGTVGCCGGSAPGTVGCCGGGGAGGDGASAPSWAPNGPINQSFQRDNTPLSQLSGPGTLAGPSDVADASTGARVGGVVYGLVATASMAASAYHGYKRNDVPHGSPLGMALWWGLMGSIFPVIVPTIAVAQGYAKPEK